MLPNYYRIKNVENKHAYNCSWAAGADCTCGKIPWGVDAPGELEENQPEHPVQTPTQDEDDDLPF